MATVELPDWMSQLPAELTTVPLWNLAIPGSHDSMTYDLDTSGPLQPDTPTWIRNLQRMFPKRVNAIVKQWTATQEESIVEQLTGGVRYFDLRIACKPKDPTHTFFFSHALYTSVTVETVMSQISRWLSQHPKEVVILACSDFDGLDSQDHQHLISLLTQVFNTALCPKKMSPSLQLCWDHKYQVILSYANSAATSHPELWPKVDYWWTKHNRTSARGVIQYLDQRLDTEGRNDSFFVAGLNLTPNTRYLILHLFSSIRSLTFKAFPQLLAWVIKQRAGATKTCINIIAGDFIGANEFTQMVVNINHTS